MLGPPRHEELLRTATSFGRPVGRLQGGPTPPLQAPPWSAWPGYGRGTQASPLPRKAASRLDSRLSTGATVGGPYPTPSPVFRPEPWLQVDLATVFRWRRGYGSNGVLGGVGSSPRSGSPARPRLRQFRGRLNTIQEILGEDRTGATCEHLVGQLLEEEVGVVLRGADYDPRRARNR